MHLRLLSTALLVSASLVSVAVSAAPRDLQDLIGRNAKNADRQMESHGYVHIERQKGANHHTWSSWWNPSKRQCVTVAYQHGKVNAITNAPAVDCNQQHYSNQDDDNAAAAAIVGVAALAGVIALEHKSHHHESGQHHDNATDEAEFERGHRDGLHNSSYTNYNHSDGYRDGYQSGVDQRSHNTSYRQHSGRHDYGYTRTVEFSDLDGARGSSADSALRDRGFRDVDAFKSGNGAYTVWYNRASGQCLQMIVANGRVDDISDIYQHPNCH